MPVGSGNGGVPWNRVVIGSARLPGLTLGAGRADDLGMRRADPEPVEAGTAEQREVGRAVEQFAALCRCESSE